MIYFAQEPSTCHIKIGFTEGEAPERVAQLQTGRSDPLVILTTMPGERLMESILHERFAAARVREDGEFFRPVPELLLLIIEAARGLPVEASGKSLRSLEDSIDPSLILATSGEKKLFVKLTTLLSEYGAIILSPENANLASLRKTIHGWIRSLLGLKGRHAELSRVFDAFDSWSKSNGHLQNYGGDGMVQMLEECLTCLWRAPNGCGGYASRFWPSEAAYDLLYPNKELTR